jgi:hypothetical protein
VLEGKILNVKRTEAERLERDNQEHKKEVAAIREKNAELKVEIQKTLEERK